MKKLFCLVIAVMMFTAVFAGCASTAPATDTASSEAAAPADDATAPCAGVDAITATHITEIDRKIADLQALRSELTRRLDRCEGGSISDCRIIEALGAGSAVMRDA